MKQRSSLHTFLISLVLALQIISINNNNTHDIAVMAHHHSQTTGEVSSCHVQ